MKSLFLGLFALLTWYCPNPPWCPPPLWLYLLCTIKLWNLYLHWSSPCLQAVSPAVDWNSPCTFQTGSFPPSSSQPLGFTPCWISLSASPTWWSSHLWLCCLQLPALLQSLTVTWPASLLLVLNSQHRFGNHLMHSWGTSDLPGAFATLLSSLLAAVPLSVISLAAPETVVLVTLST